MLKITDIKEAPEAATSVGATNKNNTLIVVEKGREVNEQVQESMDFTS